MNKIEYKKYDIKKQTDNTNGDILKVLEKYPKGLDLLEYSHNWKYLCNYSPDRNNIFIWYDFIKKDNILILGTKTGTFLEYLTNIFDSVTAVDSSQINCKIIDKKISKNINIICSELENLDFNEKFDYIIINEPLDVETNLKTAKNYIKNNGKIIMLINNDFSLHNIANGKVNNAGNNVNDLSILFRNYDLNYRYYYCFPNLNITNLIIDESFIKNQKINAPEYIYDINNTKNLEFERKMYKFLSNSKSLNLFANSFFIELSLNELTKQKKYVKFNNYRSEKYNLITCLKDGKYYKIPKTKKAEKFLEKIYQNYLLMKKNNINCLEVYLENGQCYSYVKDLKCLIEKLDQKSSVEEVIAFFEDYYKKICEIYEKNIIKKEDGLHYVKELFVDMIPANIFIENDKYLFFDQEWLIENTAIELLLFRAINSTLYEKNIIEYSDILIRHFGLDKYNELLSKIDKDYFKNIYNEYYEYYFNQDL